MKNYNPENSNHRARIAARIVETTMALQCITGTLFAQAIIAYGHAYGVNLGHILADESRTDRRNILLTLWGNYINAGRGMGMFDMAIQTENGPMPASVKFGSSADVTMHVEQFKKLFKNGAPFWVVKAFGNAIAPNRSIGPVEPATDLMMMRLNVMDLARWEIEQGNNPWEIAQKGVKDNRALYVRLDRDYPRSLLTCGWMRSLYHSQPSYPLQRSKLFLRKSDQWFVADHLECSCTKSRSMARS